MTSGVHGSDRVLIIGGGPAGLATARALTLADVPFSIVERHTDFGGLWDITSPGSPMYRSAHFISSKTMSGHEGFPMPEAFPDYPSNGQILSYVRSFAERHQLRAHTRFNTKVLRVSKSERGWLVTSITGETSHQETYRWVVCASGTNWHPRIPELSGADAFEGQLLHSSAYKDPEGLRGKRVLRRRSGQLR